MEIRGSVLVVKIDTIEKKIQTEVLATDMGYDWKCCLDNWTKSYILLIGFDKKIYCEVFLSNKTFFGAG